jgi:hypothetical protein
MMPYSSRAYMNLKLALDFKDFTKDIDIRISESGPIDTVYLSDGLLVVVVWANNLSEIQVFDLNSIDFTKDIDSVKVDMQTNSIKF